MQKKEYHIETHKQLLKGIIAEGTLEAGNIKEPLEQKGNYAIIALSDYLLALLEIQETDSLADMVVAKEVTLAHQSLIKSFILKATAEEIEASGGNRNNLSELIKNTGGGVDGFFNELFEKYQQPARQPEDFSSIVEETKEKFNSKNLLTSNSNLLKNIRGLVAEIVQMHPKYYAKMQERISKQYPNPTHLEFRKVIFDYMDALKSGKTLADLDITELEKCPSCPNNSVCVIQAIMLGILDAKEQAAKK